MRSLFLCTCLAVFATPADAHPHIFINTALEIRFDTSGRAEGIRITWDYDDLTSLQLIADRAMDPDFDGSLTADETAQLSGFDMQWEPGFAGDTYAMLGTVRLVLSAPTDWTAGYQNDIVTSSHYRRFAEPVAIDADPLIVRVYDPTYYSGYFIIGDPKLTGPRDCDAKVHKPDLDVANRIYDAAVANLSGDIENDFPAIGHAFAEEVRITCSAPF